MAEHRVEHPHTNAHPMSSLINFLDQLAAQTGKVCSIAIPLMVVITVVIVVLRYGFAIGAVAAQESVTYLHAGLFMGAMAYGLKSDAHVRVDIYYRNYDESTRQWINAIGGLVFLMPMCAALLYYGWDYAYRSWVIGETSIEPGGIPAVFLLKSVVPLAATLLFIQCLAEVLANTLRLMGYPVKRSPTKR